MIHKRTLKDHAQQLRTIAKRLAEEATGMEKDAERELFYPLKSPPHEIVGPSFSVSYGARGIILAIGDYELSREQMQDIAVSAIWAVYESQRDASNPGDPKTFKRVMDGVFNDASKRCNQRSR